MNLVQTGQVRKYFVMDTLPLMQNQIMLSVE